MRYQFLGLFVILCVTLSFFIVLFNDYGSYALNYHYIARLFSREVKIFAFIHTFPKNHATRAKAVEMTWAAKLTDYVFSTIENDKRLKKRWVFNFTDSSHNATSRVWLWSRVQAAFQKTFEEKYKDFDWFMKADDDCYYVIENIKEILANYDPSEPWYLGELISLGDHHYPSGGTGYILSKEALKRLMTTLKHPSKHCTLDKEEQEDIMIGHCFKEAGLKLIPSINEQQEHSLLPFNLKVMLHSVLNISEHQFNWYQNAAVFKPVNTGYNCCSPKLLAIHYTAPEEMVVYDYLLYKVKISSSFLAH